MVVIGGSELKKKYLYTVVLPGLTGMTMATLVFLSNQILSTKTFFPLWVCLIIPALICLLLLFLIEDLYHSYFEKEKTKVRFYIICVITFLLTVVGISYLVFRGMDLLALYLYFIPIGLITFGLRMVIYLIKRWLKK